MSNSVEEIKRRIEAACARSGRNARDVTLIGASKTVSAARLCEFYDLGLRELGENYVQEALQKQDEIASSSTRCDFKWHFIGSLQSNKARDVMGRFSLIHSVDRLSLAQSLHKEARKIGVVQDVLLQVNIGEETSKGGCAPSETLRLARKIAQLENVRVCGLMCLPPYFENPENVRPLFRRMRELCDEVSSSTRSARHPTLHLSMGMSHDFEIAIEEGATLVRLGTRLFGARN